ncbi:antibiotic biosynthesis monooxygenase [Geodermatophilus sp. TF02-6]|uniref:putative quinol monooxygenase n=1 Tax=Geodermatophilus sp. TF02-6 TaxID=2250575 RepID=UPI000DE894C7|nr:putative quinol monooxygenase [Geodermatophilus sp. TF02-6]RBY74437.1 antibiotic biosynthesis monooxygenase [Geodermatophilus sp. TF02-6]
MSVVVVATITPQPEHADAVREALVSAIPAVHDEPGCELYALHEADGALVVIERWASPEALQEHMQAQAFAELGRQLEGRMTGPAEIRVLTAVPAGDSAKGAL